jgi:hypothetical protein
VLKKCEIKCTKLYNFSRISLALVVSTSVTHSLTPTNIPTSLVERAAFAYAHVCAPNSFVEVDACRGSEISLIGEPWRPEGAAPHDVFHLSRSLTTFNNAPSITMKFKLVRALKFYRIMNPTFIYISTHIPRIFVLIILLRTHGCVTKLLLCKPFRST